MFEFIFGNTFEVDYIEHWKHTRKEDKNIKEFKSNIRDKFKSNLMANLERIDRNNERFIFEKVYHLWNGAFFANGTDLCEFEFKPFKEECIEKFKELNNLDKIYRGNKKFDDYLKECLLEKFGYENHCMMFDISNDLEIDTVSGTRIRNARTELRYALMESVAKTMNEYNYLMKDGMHRMTSMSCYPYRNDVRVLGMFNEITECWDFARTHFDITNELILEKLEKSEEKVKRDCKNKQEELAEQNESRLIAKEINKNKIKQEMEKISSTEYDPNFPF